MLMLLTHLSSRGWQIAASGNEQIGAHFLRLRGISLLLAFLVEVSQFWRGGSAAPSHPEKLGLDCKHSVEEAQASSTGTNRRRGPACSIFEAHLTVRSRQKSSVVRKKKITSFGQEHSASLFCISTGPT